jgi:hypothetical protein
VLIVFAILLLLLAWRNWQDRHDTSEPKVFSTISAMSPAAAAFLAFGAVFVNRRTSSCCSRRDRTSARASSGSKLLLGLVFVLVATLPYTAVAACAVAGGARANARLDAARAWLVARNRLITAIVLAILGAVLLVNGRRGGLTARRSGGGASRGLLLRHVSDLDDRIAVLETSSGATRGPRAPATRPRPE